MAIDLLESMSALLPPGLARQASALLGESEPNTQAALRAGGSTLLAGLMHAGSDPAQARSLFQTLSSNAVDPAIDRRLPAILGDRNQFEGLLSSGESLLGSVFGSRAGGVTHALSQVAGVKPTTATSLLAMLAPVLMGLVKNKVLQGGLNAGGLSALLLGQRDSLQKAGLDDRLTSAMGFSSLPNMLGSLSANPLKRAEDIPTATVAQLRGGRRWVPWAIAAGVLAVLVGLLFNLTRGARAPDVALDDTASRLTRAATNVYFDSGDASLDTGDQAALSSIASAAKATGKSVALTGYTDPTGDPQQNEALAQDRAKAVRMALLSSGLPESQIVMKPPAVVTGSGTDEQARRVQIETVP